MLNQPMADTPGASFNYDGGNPYLLSALITKMTGQSAFNMQRRNCSRRLASRVPTGERWMLRV